MERSICRNCSHEFTGRYCNHCGQKIFNESDKKFSSILHEAFHFLTHFEGSFFRTSKAVLAIPGKLSVDYTTGIQRKYYKPISFFLLLIVIYLIFPYAEGLNMRMEYYKHVGIFGEMMNRQITEKMLLLQISEVELAEIFHQKSQKTAKVLLLLLIPLTAIVVYLLDYRPKLKAFDYFIAATEVNIFFVLFFFLIAPIVFVASATIFGFYNIVEDTLVPVYIGIFVIWLVVFCRKFLSENWFISIASALMLMCGHAFITQVIYKTLLFQLTFLLI